MNIEQLNADFGLHGQLEFITGSGGFIQARIQNAFAEAIISSYAGQVLSFKPKHAQEDLLFLSDAAYYAADKATKGGVPVCWPWFGPDPEDKGRGGHGFVRNRQWQVFATEALADGRTSITLGLDANAETLTIWPYAFALRIEIIVGASLDIKLHTSNKNTGQLSITQGLHTYFKVGDISQVQVLGLENTHYLDKMDNGKEKSQQGAVTIAEEVDRIYTNVTNNLVIDDPSLGRRIHIQSTGNHSAVVWNPWVGTTANMGDLNKHDYKNLLCVETTNAAPDVVSIAPGKTYTLGASYTVE